MVAALQNEYQALQTLWQNQDSIQNYVVTSNGAISQLNLSGLNLDGTVSLELAGLDSLVWLDISNNNLSGTIPSFMNNNKSLSLMTEDSKLELLNISGNGFIFSDMEPIAGELNAIPEFIYSPQAGIGEPLDTFVYANNSISFGLKNYRPGESDVYKWMKNGTELPDATNEAILTIENAALQDSGYYTCTVTNTLFPDLTLFSDTITLKVLLLSDISEERFHNAPLIYPNPADNTIYIDTKNRRADLKIFNGAGTIVLEKDNLQSGWLDIKQYPHGIYIFSISNGKSVIHKKVIIN